MKHKNQVERQTANKKKKTFPKDEERKNSAEKIR